MDRDRRLAASPFFLVGAITRMHWLAHGRRSPAPQPLKMGPRATRLCAGDLTDGVEVLARVSGATQDCPAALVRQGRWFWWVEDGSWSREMAAHRTVLARVLAFLQLPVGDAAVASAVRAASFDNMRRMELGEGMREADLGTPSKPDDARSYKVRRGRVGDYARELDEDTIAYVEDRMRNRLTPVLGDLREQTAEPSELGA